MCELVERIIGKGRRTENRGRRREYVGIQVTQSPVEKYQKADEALGGALRRTHVRKCSFSSGYLFAQFLILFNKDISLTEPG